MNYLAVASDLRHRAQLLLEAAAQLENLAANGVFAETGPKRRGRKGMGPEEREEVSRRMKRFWAQRKAAV